MRCVECEAMIANPICSDCLSRGFAAWVGERLGPSGASAVFDVTAALRGLDGGIDCIKCANPIGLCAHCYSYNLITLLKSHPLVLERFVCAFGLDGALSVREGLFVPGGLQRM